MDELLPALLLMPGGNKTDSVKQGDTGMENLIYLDEYHYRLEYGTGNVVGIGPFNTEDHIKTAIEAVGEIVDFQKKK